MATQEEWLASTTYSESRKEDLRKVWENCGGKPTAQMLATVKAFIKDECYGEFKYPRGIYSRADAAKCYFGPLVHSVSTRLFGMHWFIKKIPVKDRPVAIYDTLHKPGASYIYTDYTSFEAHFTRSLMEAAENRLYRHAVSRLGGEPQEVANIMSSVKMGSNKIVFRTFNCRMDAGRMSGEMDTSASNGFTNLMLYLFASHKAGCDEKKIYGFVEGDDGLFRNDGPYPTEEDFKALGMTIKLGTTNHLERASFCGQIYDIEDLAVVTDIKEAVCRLGWTNKKYVRAKEQVRMELLRSRGFSLAYQYAACPILGPLGRKILSLTNHITVRQSIVDQMDEWERSKYLEAVSSKIASPAIGDATRALVEEMYQISTQEQKEIEDKIAGMTELGPLPFTFSDVPGDWIRYYELYNCSGNDEVPVWIPENSYSLISKLVGCGSITQLQAQQLFGGAVAVV